MPREGIIVEHPYERLAGEQVKTIHRASLEILRDPGLICFNGRAADIFAAAGADVASLPIVAAEPVDDVFAVVGPVRDAVVGRGGPGRGRARAIGRAAVPGAPEPRQRIRLGPCQHGDDHFAQLGGIIRIPRSGYG